MKQRVCVFKLFNGWYLSRTGRSTRDTRTKPAEFVYADALRFWKELGRFDHNDLLWGVSLEMLEKRKLHTPMTSDEVSELIVTMKTLRLIAQADRFDRDAEGYIAQARHAEQMAIVMRKKAAALRGELKL